MRARLEKALSPELVNRTDEVVVFAPFPEEELREVARHLIEKAIAVISASYGITVTVDDPVAVAASLVAALGPTERQHGARAVQRWIERHIETPVLESTARAATAVPLVIFCDAVTGAVVCRPVADAI